MRIGNCILTLAGCIVAFGGMQVAQVADGAEGDKGPAPRPAVSSLPKIPSELHNALQDRNFAEAVTLIDELAAKKGQADVDYLMYLKGMAL
ncbi:MAG: hypothetical protein HY290_12555, partial [Planctomycetia bacterium]|nr:hypothetical protein [Planctomycetia bacterium]